MGGSKEKSLDDEHRLWAMREHLGVRARPRDKAFDAEAVDAAVRKVQPIIDSLAHSNGEEIIATVAHQLGICFEEVKSSADIQSLEQKYLVDQKELGFGRLADELADPTVDALLFQRIHAQADAPDRWVAVLNLQATQARAYWSRPHEILHRLAEPPQKRLPFFRHRDDHRNRLERIIDLGAADVAYPRAAFGWRVKQVENRDLDWDLVRALQAQFAPTASLLSAAKAVLRFWPAPAFLLQASERGRRSQPKVDVALRIDVEGYSASAGASGIQFFGNMRVPPSSPMSHSFLTGHSISDLESLGKWVTSCGSQLADRRALTSAVRLGRFVYGIVSLL